MKWARARCVGAGSRIVAATEDLAPLAAILAEDISRTTGLRLTTGHGQPGPRDIGLAVDTTLKGEAYRLSVAEQVRIEGGNYGAVALGGATLVQALGGTATLPRMTVADRPQFDFRGLLVDVARKFHSMENLRQMVELCRLYKVRYLQLHLTDDPLFMFPSTAYPQTSAKNDHHTPPYTLDDLRGLVAYADARGVTIVPEYEVPGHSGAVNRAMPELFKIRGTKPYEHHASIDFARDDVLRAVETIVGEMCDVFRSSPYFHIGGDEADLAFAHQNADFQAAFKKYNLPNQHQLYRKFVADMNEIVKRHGKRMIVWEGFGASRTLRSGFPRT